MKTCKCVLILFTFLCLTFESSGQFNNYTRMRRGDVSRYDSSVNIDIREYRLIRHKLTLSDSLINALNTERHNNESLTKSFLAQISTKDETISRQAATIDEKNITIAGLASTTDDAVHVVRLQIFKNPTADALTKTVGGIAIGLILDFLFTR